MTDLAKDHADQMQKHMRELRCIHCRARMADEYIFRGRLAIKCWKCGELNRFVFKDWRNKPNDKMKSVSKDATQ